MDVPHNLQEISRMPMGYPGPIVFWSLQAP